MLLKLVQNSTTIKAFSVKDTTGKQGNLRWHNEAMGLIFRGNNERGERMMARDGLFLINSKGVR